MKAQPGLQLATPERNRDRAVLNPVIGVAVSGKELDVEFYAQTKRRLSLPGNKVGSLCAS